jgi:hypothetical protein
MVCDNCKKEITNVYWKEYARLKHVFCDATCYQEWWKVNVSKKFKGAGNVNWKGGKIDRTCIVCTKIFKVLPYRKDRKFCSHKCSAKFYFTGKRNPNWSGGVDREQRGELPEYREWRIKVWIRDKNTCQICKYKGKKIVAHHIKTFKYFPKERTKVENGITLCRSCRMRLHAMHRKAIDFTVILRDYMPNMG